MHILLSSFRLLRRLIIEFNKAPPLSSLLLALFLLFRRPLTVRLACILDAHHKQGYQPNSSNLHCETHIIVGNNHIDGIFLSSCKITPDDIIGACEREVSGGLTNCFDKQFVNPSVPNRLPRNMLGDRRCLTQMPLRRRSFIYSQVKINVAGVVADKISVTN